MLEMSTHCTTEYPCSVPQNTHHDNQFCEKIHFLISKMYVTSVSYIMPRLYYLGKSQIYLVFPIESMYSIEAFISKNIFSQKQLFQLIPLFIEKKDMLIFIVYSICSDLHIICFLSRNEYQKVLFEVEGRQQSWWKAFQSQQYS